LKVAYTCNAFQVALASLSYSLLLHCLRSDSSCALLQHFIHAAVFRFMHLLTAPHNSSAWLLLTPTRQSIHITSTCLTPCHCSLHDHYAPHRCIHSVLYSVPAVNVCARLDRLPMLRVCHGFTKNTRQTLAYNVAV
jgi:hypothetical protein